jgi:alpha-D-ribose 1-methylphosphonate 5-triphosphate synthase subunit PhnG
MDQSALAGTNPRAEAMRLLALAPWPLLDDLTNALQSAHTVLRGPETGLVMLRGRMGATGNEFNVGETTVTRCTVRLLSGSEGHAYIQGRNGEHARRAALCDALFQEQPDTLKPVLQAIDKHIESARLETATKSAATKVDFFTMVRGDD